MIDHDAGLPAPIIPKPQEPKIEPPLSLESRGVFIPEPTNEMWPIRLHDEKIREIVEKSLPEMVQALSQPVEPAAKDKVQEVFRSGRASKRQRSWSYSDEKDGGYIISSRGFREKRDGHDYIISGVRYAFDKQGRLAKLEYIDDEQQSYSRGQTTYSEIFAYDEGGYLTQRSIWEQYKQAVIDRFDYTAAPDGKKVPVLIKRIPRSSASGLPCSHSDRFHDSG